MTERTSLRAPAIFISRYGRGGSRCPQICDMVREAFGQAEPELTRRAAVVSDAGAVRYVLRPALGSAWDAAAGGGKEAKMRHGA